MTDDTANVAASLATLRDILQSITFADGSGSSADQVRAVLAARGAQMNTITAVAEAVASAVDQRSTLVAQRDAQTPTPEEIRAAEDRVLAATAAAAAGTGSPDDVRNATDALADLLAQKRAAERDFQTGSQAAAQALDGSTTSLPDPGQSWGPALTTLTGLLSGLTSAASSPAAFAGTPTSQTAPAVAAPSPQAPTDSSGQDLLDSLLPSKGGSGTVLPDHLPNGDLTQSDIEGRTHTSADLSAQPAALTGVHTSADVSGRPANPFVTQGGLTSAGSPTGMPAMGAPMMPMSPGMGAAQAGGNPGVASAGKKKTRPIIDGRDAELSGDDINARVATSGVIGRDDQAIGEGLTRP